MSDHSKLSLIDDVSLCAKSLDLRLDSRVMRITGNKAFLDGRSFLEEIFEASVSRVGETHDCFTTSFLLSRDSAWDDTDNS